MYPLYGIQVTQSEKIVPVQNSAYDESYSVKEILPNQNKAVGLATNNNVNEQWAIGYQG